MTARLAPMIALTLAVLALAACPKVPEPLQDKHAPRRPVAKLTLGEPEVIDAGPAADAVEVTQPSLFAQEMLPKTDADDANDEEIGDTLFALGKTADAITAYRTALSRGPSAAVWQKLGDAYVASGDSARGKRCLVESMAFDPSATDARRSLAKLALDEKDGKTARTLAEDLVARAPDDVNARRLLGRAYLQLSMWREAITEIEKVVAVKPDDPYAHNNIGFAALQIGQLEKARDHLERCLSLEPQQGYMLNNLGVAYERLGRRAEAHAAFTRAAELNPKYSSAAVNRERLASHLSDEERIESAESLLSLRTPPIDGGDVPAGVASDDADGEVDGGVDGDVDDDADSSGSGSARLAPSP